MNWTNKVSCLGLVFAIFSGVAIAKQTEDLKDLSDEFDDAKTLQDWKVHNRDHMKTFEVKGGKLIVEPDAKVDRIAWYMDDAGPLVYKQITGDFLAEIQLRVGSVKEPNRAPYGSFNSAGFVVRDPASKDGDQNWIMYNFGNQYMGFGREAKTTEDSESVLSIYDAPSKYNSGKLRVCRIGSTFYLYHWMENEKKWIAEAAAEEFERDDIPQTVDVGMIINASGTPKETRAEFDYVRFGKVGSKEECVR